MNDTDLHLITQTIEMVVRKTVNGKIDDMREDLNTHNESHEQNMQRIMPVVEAYENAQRGGKTAMRIGGIITTVGGAWLIIKQIFPNL